MSSVDVNARYEAKTFQYRMKNAILRPEQNEYRMILLGLLRDNRQPSSKHIDG